MIKLPFKLELNGPISKVLTRKEDPIKYDKEIIFELNRIYKRKLKSVFDSINYCRLQSVQSYFKSILILSKLIKKQSSPIYNFQQLYASQPQVPKTSIFNQRVKSIKINAFFKLKKFFLDKKSQQTLTILQNRQFQLLNHFISKIEQKIYRIVYQKIADYANDKKAKSKIIRLMSKLEKNLIKRAYYSDFWVKLKAIRFKENKKKLSCQKINKIQKLTEKYAKENTFHKMQLYLQSISLQTKIQLKKQRISKIHDLNSERTVAIQKQRQTLRNIKYKLDQQSIQKSHHLTQKRKSLMLSRTKFTEEFKQLHDQVLILSAEVYKLSAIFNKQCHIVMILEQKKKTLKELKRRGIDFESITLTIYKAILDVGQQGVAGFSEIVRYHQKKWDHVQNMILLDNVQIQIGFQYRKISFLERLIRAYEKRQGQSQISGSRLKPSLSSVSTSQIKLSPSASSLKSSRVINNSYNSKLRALPDPAQLTRLKEEYHSLLILIALILSKSYELKINQAITAEIQQLTELLASDLKQNQEHIQ